MEENPPLLGDPFVVLHTVVGGWPVEWYAGRLVLTDEYNEGTPDVPHWQLTEEQMLRLGKLGAIRAATDEEEQRAKNAKLLCQQAGIPWDGYYLQDE
jgi:hypothetical protein